MDGNGEPNRPRRQRLVPPISGTLADWAQEYARCGWPIYPITQSGEPLVSAAMQRAGSTDVTLITTWWRTWPDANIALPTGAATGWIAAELLGVEAQRIVHLLLPPGGIEVTWPNGSRVVLYRSHAATGSMPSQRLDEPTTGEALALLHGDGDYVLLPPSRVPHDDGH